VFAPDGLTIATAININVRDVILVNVETGERRLRLVGHEGPVSSAPAFTNDGSKLASVDYEGCRVWDSSTGALLRTIVAHPASCVSWGRDWVRDTQGAMAFAMGHHPRLGESSEVLALDEGMVRMILDRV